MVTSVKREIAKLDRDEQFKLEWKEQIPLFVKGLTESEYLVFENMFEMFADLRELACYKNLAPMMPSLEYTFDRSVKMCVIKKSHRLDKQLVLERFQEVLKFAKIPEGRPNRYVFRRKLRTMGYEMFSLIREPGEDLLEA